MEIAYNGPESEVMVPGVGVFPRRTPVEVSDEAGKELMMNPNFVGIKPVGGKK